MMLYEHEKNSNTYRCVNKQVQIICKYRIYIKTGKFILDNFFLWFTCVSMLWKWSGKIQLTDSTAYLCGSVGIGSETQRRIGSSSVMF